MHIISCNLRQYVSKIIRTVLKLEEFAFFVVCYIFIVPALHAEKETCSVFWQSMTPLTLGHDIKLECTANGSKCTGTFKWDGGPNNDVISFENSIINRTKYSLDRRTLEKYTLIIKDLSKRDLNVSYFCHRGFFFSGKNLQKQYHKTDSSTTIISGMFAFIACFLSVMILI